MKLYSSRGWFRESYRHSLAASGVKTSFKAKKPQVVVDWGRWHRFATPEMKEERIRKLKENKLLRDLRLAKVAEEKEFEKEVGPEKFKELQELKRKRALEEALAKILGPVSGISQFEQEKLALPKDQVIVAGEAKLAKEAAKEVEEEKKKKTTDEEEDEFYFGPDMAGKRRSFSMTEEQINEQMKIEQEIGDTIARGDPDWKAKVGELRKKLQAVRERNVNMVAAAAIPIVDTYLKGMQERKTERLRQMGERRAENLRHVHAIKEIRMMKKEPGDDGIGLGLWPEGGREPGPKNEWVIVD